MLTVDQIQSFIAKGVRAVLLVAQVHVAKLKNAKETHYC